MKKLILSLVIFVMFSSCAYAKTKVSPIQKIKIKKEIKNYDKLIDENQNDAELYFKRGKLYWAINKNNDAKTDFRCAYGINPKYEDAYLYSGLVYFFDDELGWAFEEFDKLLQINPKNKYALQMQAYIYFYFHDYKNETKVKKILAEIN